MKRIFVWLILSLFVGSAWGASAEIAGKDSTSGQLEIVTSTISGAHTSLDVNVVGGGGGGTSTITGPDSTTTTPATVTTTVDGIHTGLDVHATVAPSMGTYTDRSGTITAGGTAQTLAAINASRRYLLVCNNSLADEWVNFTTAAVTSQPSIRVFSGQCFVWEGSSVSTQLVSIIGGTTGQSFTAKEM